MTTRRIASVLIAAAVALLAIAAPAPARAQQPPPAAGAVTINQLDASAYPELRAVVTALDAGRVPVQNLTVAQFTATEGQKPLTISAVQKATDASLRLGVVVVIDVSGSMAEALPGAKAAATAFVQNLGPNDEAALIAFSDKVTPLVPLTADKQRLTDGIASLVAGGGTALYEAVATSAYIARLAQTPRAAVVFLTDGENDTKDSPATRDGSITAAKGTRVPVFTIGFGASPDEAYLRDLSAQTQGEYRAASSGDVATVYQSIAALLRSQYVLTLRDAAPADGAQATLRIQATIAGQPAFADAAFARGVAAVVAPTLAPPTAVPPVASDTQAKPASSGRSVLPIVLAIVGVIAALAIVFLLILPWLRRRRARRRQLAITAPNPGLAAAQGLPDQHAGDAYAGEHGAGRLIEVNGAHPQPSFAFESTPLAIGSEAGCDVRIDPAADVAARHALVWMKDGKIMLRHTGGPRRTTLIAGRPVTWVTLEDGDEFAIGPHRYRAERVRG